MLGQFVNNYEIIGLLGEGGMGAVYAAQHRLIGRKVAIKVLKHDLAREPEVVQRFFNEARAIGALRHPNIIEVIDVGKLASGVPYLVMELLYGESLSERVTRLGPLPFDVAVDFVSQAAHALQVAHDSGIIHRDLKPENLFITLAHDGRRETIKVLDFGIAKLRDDLTATPVHTRVGSLLGTPLYMSPEQCRGLEELDVRTDVYSLGVILYEAVCGAPPFLAKSIGEVMRMHMSDMPEPPSVKRADLPLQIEHVILKCLGKDPDERFANMLELQAALELSGLASTEPDTPLHGVRGSAHGALLARQTPIDASGGLRQSARSRRSSLRDARAGASSRLALWSVVLSIVALGVPDQRLPRADVQASVAQLAAAVVVAPLRLAAAIETSAGSDAAGATAFIASQSSQGARPRLAVIPARAAGRPVETSIAAARAGAREPRGLVGASLAQSATILHPDPQPTAAAVGLAPGFLSLDSAPWAEVFLGDAALGTTPLIKVALPPGRHQLTLRNSELDTSTTYVVEIKSGQSLARLVGWGR